MSRGRQAALVVGYPLTILLSQSILFLAVAILISPPYTVETGLSFFRIVFVMALSAALCTGFLALLFQGNNPPGWRRVLVLWTVALFFFAAIWAVLMPPADIVDAITVQPGGAWLISLSGALGFWQVARVLQARRAQRSI